MNTRYITVRTNRGNFSQEVTAIRRDKRGLLVEVPAGTWLPWKGQYKSGGDRFYVPVNQARKSL